LLILRVYGILNYSLLVGEIMARLTPPVEQHPERIVEDVYEQPPHSLEQDYLSRDGFEEFLKARLQQETPLKPGGRIYVPGDTYNVTRFERSG